MSAHYIPKFETCSTKRHCAHAGALFEHAPLGLSGWVSGKWGRGPPGLHNSICYTRRPPLPKFTMGLIKMRTTRALTWGSLSLSLLAAQTKLLAGEKKQLWWEQREQRERERARASRGRKEGERRMGCGKRARRNMLSPRATSSPRLPAARPICISSSPRVVGTRSTVDGDHVPERGLLTSLE